MENKISRDSVANIIAGVIANYQMKPGISLINLNGQNKQFGKSGVAKLKTIKRKVKKTEPLSPNFYTKYIRKKSKKIKVRSAKVTEEYKAKCLELCSKNYCNYLVVVNCFRADSKGKLNLAFRNRTRLELNFDVFDKEGNKVYFSKTSEIVNLKYAMEPKVILHYVQTLSLENIKEIELYLNSLTIKK